VLGEDGELCAPAPPELGEAVQQHDQGPTGVGVLGQGLDDMEPGPVGSDVPVLPGARDLDDSRRVGR
jgi:hypothetical protein